MLSCYRFSEKTNKLLESYGLVANMISWEDTARSKNSCWGPNISDMSLATTSYTCPMIRRPNFTDITYDIPIDKFSLFVGNESGLEITTVSLKEKLEELGLYDQRDSVILTSAQTCVLSCETDVEFAVQLYNYQSSDREPAALTIMATDKGTSIQVLGTNRDKLYFNNQGTAHMIKAERLADVRARLTGIKQKAVKKLSEMTSKEKSENVIMVFQVPLENENESYFYSSEEDEDEEEDGSTGSGAGGLFCGSGSDSDDDDDAKGVDMAVLSLGKKIGPYPVLRNRKLVRDARFPIRCTLQYYRVNDTNELEESVIQDIKHTLDNLENESIAFGSLVSNATDRKTEPLLHLHLQLQGAPRVATREPEFYMPHAPF